MGLVFFIAIVFGSIIFILLISLISMDDQRAKIRLRTRLITREAPTPIPWKTRLSTFLDAVKIPDLFNQLVDERTVIWSGIDMTHHQYIAFWWLLSLMGIIPGAAVVGFSSGDLAMGLLGFALVLFLAIGPYLYLKFRIRERKREVERSLPDFLDMLTFTVEAGLGLVPALKRVSKGIIGVFGEELQHALVQIELGFSQREALEKLVIRNPSSDVEYFVEAILLSERLGTSLARTMRVQADLLRTRRRQRAEVMAQTAPIRIIPALVFFFLPSLLLIYLAPPIINFLFRR
jgi:Flp pilus assembly protein TadB